MLNKYSEAVDWIFSQFPSYQQVGGSAYKPGLENIQALLQHLGNPEKELQFIHVAGTNGKGSTCAFTASFLQQKGFRVGLFSSPHLVDFRERIRINGQCISKDTVVTFCQQIVKTPIDSSFFEITLAMALLYFKQERCDYVVLETGMGGRLDATNVVRPLVSVITQIGYDHQAFLGETLPEIANEKAGIIKEGVPVLCGEEREALKKVFQAKAQLYHAPIHFINSSIDDPNEQMPLYQRKNAALALKALSLLGFNPQEFNAIDTWQHLFKTTGLLGRLTPSQKFANLWYDASHNADGLQTTLKALGNMGVKELTVVFGASNDKPLEHLSEYKIERWVFCEFTNARSYRGSTLVEAVEKLPLSEVHYAAEVNEGIEKALQMRKGTEGILVTGSFFLLSDCAEIQEILRNQ